MNELEEFWMENLSKAIENAKGTGRHDVADYLSLKAANDTLRQTSVKWLFDSMIELAANANRSNSRIEIEHETPHNFAHRGANLAGSLLRIRQGVRCLTVEAGWTRTPTDGFMRLGALAFARITHFGLPKSNSELILLTSDGRPVWNSVLDDKPAGKFRLEHLQDHFRIFTGE